MDHDAYDDAYISSVLGDVRRIAIVGASANTVRPSFFVAKYLLAKGYDVLPVNPGRAGGEIAGVPAYASLADVPGAIDMVDVFRRVDALPGIVDEVLALEPLPKVVWLQLAIRDDEQASRLESRGIRVVQDRCPKIEYARLSGEIGWTGFNRRMISSRRPTLQAGFQHFGLPGVARK